MHSAWVNTSGERQGSEIRDGDVEKEADEWWYH
jgi:hypothetical protein